MIGRLCLKLTGREAGKYCVIVNKIDDNFVLIDGNIKRRKCNINHLEFTEKVLDIKKDASTEDILNAMKKSGIGIVKRKEIKQNKEKPKKNRSSNKHIKLGKKINKNVKAK
jgi:large subunit ribosomal protein L14e